MQQVRLTEQDYMDVIKAPPLKTPDKQEIMVRQKYLLSVKQNGDMVLSDVQARSLPYPKDIGNGRKAWYIDVAGDGFRESVNIKKLRCLPEV